MSAAPAVEPAGERDPVTEKVIANMPGRSAKRRPRAVREPKAEAPKPKRTAKPKGGRKAKPKGGRKAKPKAAREPRERSWQSLAAARASELRGASRRIGPVQIERVVAAIGEPLTVERVIEASGMKSKPAISHAAGHGGKDMKPMRDLAKRVGDAFCTGRWLAAELVAILEHVESAN